MCADAINETIASQLKALSHPMRIALLRLMTDASAFPDNLVDVETVGVCINDLAASSGMPQPTASRHIRVLSDAGVIEITRHGQWRYARPNDQVLHKLAATVASLAPR